MDKPEKTYPLLKINKICKVKLVCVLTNSGKGSNELFSPIKN